MTKEDFVKGAACDAAWRAAGGELTKAIGCLFVIRNRADHTELDWMATVDDFRERFIAPDNPIKPDIHNPDFVGLLQQVDTIYDKTIADAMTGGAQDYVDLRDLGSQPKLMMLARTPGVWRRSAQVGTVVYFARTEE